MDEVFYCPTCGNPAPKQLRGLSPRQLETLEQLVKGSSNKKIARDLDIAEGTVKVHMHALFTALQVDNRVQAAVAGAKLFDLLREEQEAAKPESD